MLLAVGVIGVPLRQEPGAGVAKCSQPKQVRAFQGACDDAVSMIFSVQPLCWPWGFQLACCCAGGRVGCCPDRWVGRLNDRCWQSHRLEDKSSYVFSKQGLDNTAQDACKLRNRNPCFRRGRREWRAQALTCLRFLGWSKQSKIGLYVCRRF